MKHCHFQQRLPVAAFRGCCVRKAAFSQTIAFAQKSLCDQQNQWTPVSLRVVDWFLSVARFGKLILPRSWDEIITSSPLGTLCVTPGAVSNFPGIRWFLHGSFSVRGCKQPSTDTERFGLCAYSCFSTWPQSLCISLCSVTHMDAAWRPISHWHSQPALI